PGLSRSEVPPRSAWLRVHTRRAGGDAPRHHRRPQPRGGPRRVTTLLIDNYDSFTYNLYQCLSELGADVIVKRNDEATVEECLALEPDHVVISPGPGDPDDAGISRDVIRAFAGKVPVLGVCLGHQC